MRVIKRETTKQKRKSGKVLDVVKSKKKSVVPKADPVVETIKKISAQLAGILEKKVPAPVITVKPTAPVITVKQPEIVFPGPPKKWEFTGTKTGNTWKIIAERIE